MKNLVLPTLIAAVASLAAGCIIFADDGNSGLGNIQVTWSLKSTDVGGNPIVLQQYLTASPSELQGYLAGNPFALQA